MQREKMIWMRKDGEWMRCGKCRHKLFKYTGEALLQGVEIKCHSCKALNSSDEPKDWYVFTFGYGQEHKGKFVRFYGTYGEAQAQMCDRFGDKWAFQYRMDEWLRSPYATEKELILPTCAQDAPCEVA